MADSPIWSRLSGRRARTPGRLTTTSTSTGSSRKGKHIIGSCTNRRPSAVIGGGGRGRAEGGGGHCFASAWVCRAKTHRDNLSSLPPSRLYRGRGPSRPFSLPRTERGGPQPHRRPSREREFEGPGAKEQERSPAAAAPPTTDPPPTTLAATHNTRPVQSQYSSALPTRTSTDSPPPSPHGPITHPHSLAATIIVPQTNNQTPSPSSLPPSTYIQSVMRTVQ